ncbi:MAG: hypothetical protein ABIZ57_12050 [Candidatus Limnocylindria bacterium]
MSASDDAGVLTDALTDIGEELRHLFDHMSDARYFAYLGIAASHDTQGV